jgi:nucleotide-binding universal stress UspA family protein
VFGVGRVLVGTSGSPGSLHALRYGEGLACALDAVLIPVIAWELPGGDRAHRVGSSRELGHACRDLAGKQLRDALVAVWGEVPDDPRVQPHVERGPAGWVLVSLASRPDDVLVVGAGRRGTLGRLAFPRWAATAGPMPSVPLSPSRRPPWLASSGMAAWHGRSGAGP